MAEPIKIFLSSTARDLYSYREAICLAIDGLDGYRCIRMEQFGARNAESSEFCCEQVAKCDLFVGVVGLLYGSIPKGCEISYTELEYDTAVHPPIPPPKSRLMFVAPGNFPVSGDLFEGKDKRDKQEAFRDRVRKDRLCDVRPEIFSSPDRLAISVTTAIENWRETQPPGSPPTPDNVSPAAVQAPRVDPGQNLPGPGPEDPDRDGKPSGAGENSDGSPAWWLKILILAILTTAAVVALAAFLTRGPGGETPDREYFPIARIGGKVVDGFRVNPGDLGKGTKVSRLSSGALRISRQPSSELFYGVTLTVAPGGYDSWKEYLQGELEVDFAVFHPGQVLILKAECLGEPQWISNEIVLHGEAGQADPEGRPAACHVSVAELIANQPKEFQNRVMRLTVEERFTTEPQTERTFELQRVMLRPKEPARR